VSNQYQKIINISNIYYPTSLAHAHEKSSCNGLYKNGKAKQCSYNWVWLTGMNLFEMIA